MTRITLRLGFAEIAAAIGIPLRIEYLKRPQLRIERANDLNSEPLGTMMRIVHIRVVNSPIEGRTGRWLLRNPADGCRVTITLRSRSDGSESGPGWSDTVK
jgi:hypothetical protein